MLNQHRSSQIGRGPTRWDHSLGRPDPSAAAGTASLGAMTWRGQPPAPDASRPGGPASGRAS